jgi:fermentation-respiration switch protein FrsA (DUF1100 family)
VFQPILNRFLFFPTASIEQEPADAGLTARELSVPTGDGERLHAWFVEASGARRASVLLCHGNGGNVGDRVEHARLLVDAGFDVLLFDYRGYAQSTGTPSEDGTYRDALAARQALLDQAGVNPGRIVYLGESLGGAVALWLALEHPPAGLVLQSAFTSVRDVAAFHYRLLPRVLVPDAFPSLRRIERLQCPLLVVHGEADEVVPASHGERLYAVAPEPKSLRTVPGVGHNDLVSLAGDQYAKAVAEWWDDLRGGASARGGQRTPAA